MTEDQTERRELLGDRLVKMIGARIKVSLVDYAEEHTEPDWEAIGRHVLISIDTERNIIFKELLAKELGRARWESVNIGNTKEFEEYWKEKHIDVIRVKHQCAEDAGIIQRATMRLLEDFNNLSFTE